MEYVDPIKDIESINKMKRLLRQKSKRDYLLFVFGINTGIRISDLLNLTVKDVWDGEKAKEFLTIAATGNHKGQTLFLNNNVKEALNIYLLNTRLNDNSFIFKTKNDEKPVTRQQAYRIINQAAKAVGIQGKVGTHTIRKTFGYHAYSKGIAISLIQEIFGHTCPSETLGYLGIDEEERKKFIKVDVNL